MGGMKYLLPLVMLAVAVAAAEKAPEKAPRMRDGHPDLSGNWSYATLTTLERPKEFGNKAFLTTAEAADLEKTILTVQNRDRRDGEGRTAAARTAARISIARTARPGGSTDRSSSARGARR